jgi:hypothetical protein
MLSSSSTTDLSKISVRLDSGYYKSVPMLVRTGLFLCYENSILEVIKIEIIIVSC